MRRQMIVGAVLWSFACGAASAQNVVRDHTSNAPIFGSYLDRALNNISTDGGLSGRSISPFVRDGNNLLRYGAFYTNRSGPENGFLWDQTDFRLDFWHSANQLVQDPGMQNPTPLDRSIIFNEPSNANWRTPVGLLDGEAWVFWFEFYLEPHQIQTTPGQTQFISVAGVCPSFPEEAAFLLASDFGPGRIGPDFCYIVYGTLGTPFLDGASISDRLTTVPAPSGAAALLLLAAGARWRRRR